MLCKLQDIQLGLCYGVYSSHLYTKLLLMEPCYNVPYYRSKMGDHLEKIPGTLLAQDKLISPVQEL